MIQRVALRTLTPAVLLGGARCFSAGAPPPRVAVPSSSAAAASSPANRFRSPSIPPETDEALEGLEPTTLWSHFASVSSIPRPSGREGPVLSYVKGCADSLGLPWKEDDAGNLCVFRPGSGGGERAPPVIVQGHVDMVTEANAGTDHDFTVDPIRMRRFLADDDGGGDRTWIGARGTTLGADNGLGVAAALALLGSDKAKPLPPLQALFTVDEETGLKGAAKLDAKALGLTGKTMLNLDTEEWGDLFVGCAGGGDATITIPLEREDDAGGGSSGSSSQHELIEIRVEGLMGGHSGIDIHEGRANAIVLCASAARKALDAVSAIEPGCANLVSIRGGDKHNAIPREASALLALSESSTPSAREALVRSVRDSASAASEEYGTLEKNLRLEARTAAAVAPGRSALAPLDGPSASRLLSVLLALPHGPLKYSHALPDLVETSNNVASVSADDDATTILCSSRSSVAPALEHTRDRIEAVATLAGGSVEFSESYPGWNPDPNSPILGLTRRLLEGRLGRAPGVNAVHAGLECGLLIEKLGGDVDVISFGPTIEGAHSPDERVDAGTVRPFFGLVEDVLAELAVAS